MNKGQNDKFESIKTSKLQILDVSINGNVSEYVYGHVGKILLHVTIESTTETKYQHPRKQIFRPITSIWWP